jgi:hypothetical protein
MPRNVDIDDEKRWRLKLASVVEVESRFKDKRKDAVFLSWRFRVHDIETGVAVLDDNTGDPFELWVPTNDATFFSPDTGKMGGARDMGTTLLGRTLTDEEVRAMNAAGVEGWANVLVGKTMIADVEWTQTEAGYDRLKLLRKRPDTQTRTAVAPPPPPPNGEAKPAESAEDRRARLRRELEEAGG